MPNYDKLTPKEALQQWKAHCETVQEATTVDAHETDAQKKQRIKRLLSDYGAFVDYYFPHYTTNPQTGRQTPCAPFHLKAAKQIISDRNVKAVFKWHRGAAKSTHLDIFIPMWLKAQIYGGAELRQFWVMVLVGKSQDNANTLLADLQAELQYNKRYAADFGEQYNNGTWEEGSFVTKDGTAFFARGRGQSPRGLRYRSHRPDYIVIDDLDDDELCENPARVSRLTDWVKEALFGALDGGRGRFIMVGNLISKTSVLFNLAHTKGVFLSKIVAVDANGEPVWREKWTKEEAQAYADFVGFRAWNKEMMHNPIKDGTIFRHDWIRYKKVLPLNKYDQLICYTDPSFKSTTANDYKASRFWGKIGTEFHLIDCYVRQDTVGGMVRWLYNLYESLPEDVTVSFFMEANFLQDTILDEFTEEGNRRGYQLPITGDKRKKPDKLQRIEAISPLWERGFVFYNEALKESPDMQVGIEQTLSLERGSRVHDDAPDADEGAIWMLQRNTRQVIYKPRFGKRPTSKNSW